MLRATLARLRADRVRLLMSAVSIVLGVAFVTGTLVFTASVKTAVFDRFAAQARHVDAAIEPRSADDLTAGHASVPTGLLPDVRHVPGVAAVEPRMTADLPVLARDGTVIRNGTQVGVGVDVPADPRFQSFTLTRGRLPQADSEALLDTDTATEHRFAPGDTLTVLDPHQARHVFMLVGLVDLGASGGAEAGSVVALRPEALRSVARVRGYQFIAVAAAPGVGQAALARRLRPVAQGYPVVTGSRLAHDLANGRLRAVDTLLVGLLIFGFVALLVAALVIYNTFKILIAQRSRELALLRCVGATRRQVFGGVVVEAVVLGLAGSVLGVVAGFGVAAGMRVLLDAFGAGFPSGRLAVSGGALVLGPLVGTAVTVLASLFPASLATRVAPVAALRVSAQDRAGAPRLRAMVGVLLAAAGVVLSVAAVPSGQNGLPAVVAGGVVTFGGVLLLGPLLVSLLTLPLTLLPSTLPFTRQRPTPESTPLPAGKPPSRRPPSGTPPSERTPSERLSSGMLRSERLISGKPASGGRLSGVPFRLAVAGVRRNPGRTATTMIALTAGVGLMTLFTVVLATAQHFGNVQLERHFPFDYQVGSVGARDSASIPVRVAGRLRADARIGAVGEVRVASMRDGAVLSVDPEAYGRIYRPSTSAGTLSSLPGGSVALYRHGRVGDTVTLRLPEGPRSFRVAAVFTDNTLAGERVVMAWNDFRDAFGPGPDFQVLVKTRTGVSPAASRAAVDHAVAGSPLTTVLSAAAYRAQINTAINQVTGLLGALLATAILIALLGIANTLSLSIIERTRESALLRALGLTRGQLGRTLTTEALIVGLLGGLVGVALGVWGGWVTSQAILHDSGGGTVVCPVWQIAGYLALAGLAGVAASLVPVRGAARSSVVSGLG